VPDAEYAGGNGVICDYAGEILVQSVDRDGSLRGYPLAFGSRFLSVGVPVIIGSGCEGYRSMLQGFEAGFDACATSNIHHFSPTGMKSMKTLLQQKGVLLRDDDTRFISERTILDESQMRAC
jgi:cyclase